MQTWYRKLFNFWQLSSLFHIFSSNEWSRLNSLWCLFFSKFLLKPLKGLIILTNPTVIRGENFELDIRVCCLLSNISLRMFYLGWVPRECYICAYLLREKSSHYNTWDTLQNWHLSSANITWTPVTSCFILSETSQFAKRKNDIDIWSMTETEWLTWMDWGLNFASHFRLTWLKFVTALSALLRLFQD